MRVEAVDAEGRVPRALGAFLHYLRHGRELCQDAPCLWARLSACFRMLPRPIGRSLIGMRLHKTPQIAQPDALPLEARLLDDDVELSGPQALALVYKLFV